jgi:hypothetical protein
MKQARVCLPEVVGTTAQAVCPEAGLRVLVTALLEALQGEGWWRK